MPGVLGQGYEFQKALQTKMASVGRTGATLVGDGLGERKTWPAFLSATALDDGKFTVT